MFHILGCTLWDLQSRIEYIYIFQILKYNFCILNCIYQNTKTKNITCFNTDKLFCHCWNSLLLIICWVYLIYIAFLH